MRSSAYFNSGIVTAIALFLFFLLMDLAGYAHIWELRFFNAFILLIGIRYTILRVQENDKSYLGGYFSGIKTTVVAVSLFLILFLFYTTVVNPEFFEIVDSKRLSPFAVDKFSVIPAILFEGICSGIVLTFIAMQYYKAPDRVY